MKKTNHSKAFWAILVIVVLLLVNSFSTIINFVTDYKWFAELNLTGTFLTKLKMQFAIGIPIFLVITLLFRFYMGFLKGKYYEISGISPQSQNDKGLNKVFLWGSIAIGFFAASAFVSRLWFSFLEFKEGAQFGLADPLFNHDIGFYFFKLPFLRDISNTLINLAVLIVVVTIGIQILLMVTRRPIDDMTSGFEALKDQRELMHRLNETLFGTMLKQVGILAFVIMLTLGFSFIFKSYDLLYSTRGKVFGAGYTDVHVTLFINRILAVVAFVGAFSVSIGIVKKKKRWIVLPIVSILGLSLISFLGGQIVQNFIVVPNEIDKEQAYLEYSIKYTQKAFNLDNVEKLNFPFEQKISLDDLEKNKATVSNIRINDYRPIGQVYNQLQSLRPYYNFKDVDVDRYTIDGDYRQVFLAARELNQENLNARAKTWINKHLKYTHGYGVVLSPVNQIDAAGQPELLIENIPAIYHTDLKVKRPEIYFGELTNDYIIVNTDEKEFDYALQDTNAETTYEGKAGISLKGLNRLLFAIKEGSTDMIFSSAINSDSKIIKHRNIMERVNRIAPFLKYDQDPYMVINQEDGKLYWMIDAYTYSDRYPYAQPYLETGINYVRNSVKVVIDAYDGTTQFYIYDETDPLLQTYGRIFKDLFKPKSEMPKGLVSHVRYPKTLFEIQAEMYRIYHIEDPMVFYNKEDVWDVAQEKYMEGVDKVTPNYVMFKMPDSETEEFLLNVPYTPSGKPNMSSLLVARNDGDNYGKLFLYRFPKEKSVPGPIMIETKIDQDSDISSQMTLWGQKGSTVLRGNVLTVPIENSLLYVEPIYLQADNENSIPEVRRVIVSYEDKIVMEPTLEGALAKIFGTKEVKEPEKAVDESKDTTTDPVLGTMTEKIAEANKVFELAQEALKSSNWAEYGKQMQQLEKILKDLNQ